MKEVNDLKNIAPVTSKIKKEFPFGIPDNYFASFSDRLQYRLHAEEEVLPQKKKTIIRYLKPALALAASFVLVFMLVYWPISVFLPDFLAQTNTATEQEIEMDTYLSSFEQIDENLFFAIINDLTEEKETEEDFNDDELLSYLSANVSDYELCLHTEN
mgnify:CR=1 FL=1